MKEFDEDLISVIRQMRRGGQSASRISVKMQITEIEVMEMVNELSNRARIAAKTQDGQYIRPAPQLNEHEISRIYKGRRYDGRHVKK